MKNQETMERREKRSKERKLKRKILKDIFKRRLKKWYQNFDENENVIKVRVVNTTYIFDKQFKEYIIITELDGMKFMYFYTEIDKMFSYVTMM